MQTKGLRGTPLIHGCLSSREVSVAECAIFCRPPPSVRNLPLERLSAAGGRHFARGLVRLHLV